MRAGPPAVTPPSMASVCPVMNEASSDVSHTTARAISTGSAPRCIGVSSICDCFHPGIMASSRSTIAVSVNPGATALTRHAEASVLVRGHPGEPDYARLRGGVGTCPCGAGQPGERGRVNDRSLALGKHQLELVMEREEHAHQVDS